MALEKTVIPNKNRLSAEDRRNIRRLLKKAESHITIIEEGFKKITMSLPEKEEMFPSDDNNSIK